MAVAGVFGLILAGTVAAMARPRDGGSDAAAGVAADTPGYWGFDTKNLDRSCKPCDDFFEFAMGGWMKANPIPPQYPRWGSFTVLLDKNQQNLRTILEAEEKTTSTPGSNGQKIGDFYASCMDTTAIDKAGLTPLPSVTPESVAPEAR